MSEPTIGFYARVSSEQQEEAGTIESQVAICGNGSRKMDMYFQTSWPSSTMVTAGPRSFDRHSSGCGM